MRLCQQDLAFFRRKIFARRKDLPQQRTQLLLEKSRRHTRLHPANNIEPISIRVAYIRSVCQHRHRLNRQIEIRRRARHPIAKETLRRDPGNRHRLGIHPERTANDGSIAGIIVLPRLVAHHCNHRRADNVVRIGDEPSRLRLQTEGAKVVARDKLAHHRPRTLLASIAPCNDWPEAKSRLHRRQFLKLRRVLLQLLIRVGREQRIVAIVARPPTHAAVVVVAKPEQRLRICHRQVLKQHRMDQRKDRSVRPNAQRQRQNGGHRESRGLLQLPQRVAKILDQIRNHHDSVHSTQTRSCTKQAIIPLNCFNDLQVASPGELSNNFLRCSPPDTSQALDRTWATPGRWNQLLQLSPQFLERICSKWIDSNGANSLVFY